MNASDMPLFEMTPELLHLPLSCKTGDLRVIHPHGLLPIVHLLTKCDIFFQIRILRYLARVAKLNVDNAQCMAEAGLVAAVCHAFKPRLRKEHKTSSADPLWLAVLKLLHILLPFSPAIYLNALFSCIHPDYEWQVLARVCCFFFFVFVFDFLFCFVLFCFFCFFLFLFLFFFLFFFVGFLLFPFCFFWFVLLILFVFV